MLFFSFPEFLCLMSDDTNFPNRWYLGDVAFADNWELLNQLKPEREYEVQICRNGIEMDYTCNEAYGVCIVSQRFKEALAGIKGVQFAKANVTGSSSNKHFYIMSVINEVDCIDEEKSKFKDLFERKSY